MKLCEPSWGCTAGRRIRRRGEAPWSLHRSFWVAADFVWALLGLSLLALDGREDTAPACRRASPEIFAAAHACAWLGVSVGVWSAWSTVAPRILKRRLGRASPEAIERHTELAELSEAELGVTQCCPICLEDFAPARVMRIKGCGHVFHEGCVRSWLASVASCPLCRKEVVHGLAAV